VAKRSTIRASDADRDGVIERLREAAGEGRLAAHELEHRVTTALKARTYGELDATVSDLPDAARTPGRRRSAPGWAIATVREHPIALLAVIPILMVVIATMIAIAVMWTVVTVLALVLGHHRRLHRMGPWRGGLPPTRHPRHYL
jgi:hypothetical protein